MKGPLRMSVNISLDELRAVLESKGLDIKELAKEAKGLKSAPQSVVESKQVNRPKRAPVFELALVNYPDFVIRKSTSKTEKMLVFMVSQDSYYIKTIKNGFEEIEPLDEDNYSKFTSGMTDMYLPEDFWLKRIMSGKVFFNAIMRELSLSGTKKAILGKYYFQNNINKDGDFAYSIEMREKMYSKIPYLLKCKDFKQEYIWDWEAFYDIMEKFGLDNARVFIKELGNSLVHVDSCYTLKYLLDEYEFDFTSFKDYVLYDSVRLGYAMSFSQFIYTWKDTLSMQEQLWGKVKDKYPEHLSDFHNQLSYKCLLMKREGYKTQIVNRAKKASVLEATIGDYTFIIPKQPQDFYDEATAMSNCLASYVDKYATGKDYIVFMRHKDTPEKSLVTIEISLNGNLIQAYQERNTNVTERQLNAINAWLTKVVKPNIRKM
jgi:hypothetical protein